MVMGGHYLSYQGANPGGFYPDLDPTFEKNRILIRPSRNKNLYSASYTMLTYKNSPLMMYNVMFTHTGLHLKMIRM